MDDLPAQLGVLVRNIGPRAMPCEFGGLRPFVPVAAAEQSRSPIIAATQRPTVEIF